MTSRSSRILSAVLTLAMLFSFALAAFSADVPDDAQRRSESIISTDPLATDDDVLFDAESGEVTLKSGQALRLTYNGSTTDHTTIQWSSSEEDAASIAEDGTVTTGSSCKAAFFRTYKIAVPAGCMMGADGTIRTIYMYLPIPIPTLPYFEGRTNVTLTVTDPVTDPQTGETTEQTQTETIRLTVEHTFREWLQAKF